jgi:hypothetical protein
VKAKAKPILEIRMDMTRFLSCKSSAKCMLNLKHKILLVLTAITVIGEFASIILWVSNRPVAGESYARFSLAVDYRIAVANAAVFLALNLVAFASIFRKNKTGSLFLLVISVLNRFISYPIFIGGAHGIFITWTSLLVIFSYAEYRGLSNFNIAFLSGGVILDLATTALLFKPADSSTGIVFYFVVLSCIVGIAAAIKKLR